MAKGKKELVKTVITVFGTRRWADVVDAVRVLHGERTCDPEPNMHAFFLRLLGEHAHDLGLSLPERLPEGYEEIPRRARHRKENRTATRHLVISIRGTEEWLIGAEQVWAETVKRTQARIPSMTQFAEWLIAKCATELGFSELPLRGSENHLGTRYGSPPKIKVEKPRPKRLKH